MQLQRICKGIFIFILALFILAGHEAYSQTNEVIVNEYGNIGKSFPRDLRNNPLSIAVQYDTSTNKFYYLDFTGGGEISNGRINKIFPKDLRGNPVSVLATYDPVTEKFNWFKQGDYLPASDTASIADSFAVARGERDVLQAVNDAQDIAIADAGKWVQYDAVGTYKVAAPKWTPTPGDTTVAKIDNESRQYYNWGGYFSHYNQQFHATFNATTPGHNYATALQISKSPAFLNLYAFGSAYMTMEGYANIYGSGLYYSTTNLKHHIWTVSTNGFAQDASKEAMRLTAYGKLGIGITNPTNRLEVAGNIKMPKDSTIDAGIVKTPRVLLDSSLYMETDSAYVSFTGGETLIGGGPGLVTREYTIRYKKLYSYAAGPRIVIRSDSVNGIVIPFVEIVSFGAGNNYRRGTPEFGMLWYSDPGMARYRISNKAAPHNGYTPLGELDGPASNNNRAIQFDQPNHQNYGSSYMLMLQGHANNTCEQVVIKLKIYFTKTTHAPYSGPYLASLSVDGNPIP